MLEERLNEWMQKVLKAYDNKSVYMCINTFQMIVDVDKIISEEFDNEPIFAECI